MPSSASNFPMLLPVTLLLVSFDPAAASAYLKESASWCDAEGKALWNRSLCGPIVIASPQTREFVTSEGARGTFPPERTLANTAFDWNGRKWTMLLWPLPEDAESRKALFAHELWHRIQADIGFPATGPVNAHLEEAEGRIWMRLEGKALRRALESKGDARRRAVQEALSFRHRRHAIFRSAEAEERALEMHEGLAEYTGVAASGAADRLAPAGLARLENGGGFARTFAYATGPAYGVLLDAHSENWRAGLTPNRSLAALLAAAADVKPGDPFDGASAYGGGAIRQQELQLERDRIARVARHRKRFVEGPVLELPVAGKFNRANSPNARQAAAS